MESLVYVTALAGIVKEGVAVIMDDPRQADEAVAFVFRHRRLIGTGLDLGRAGIRLPVA